MVRFSDKSLLKLLLASILVVAPCAGVHAEPPVDKDSATALVQDPPGFGFSEWVRKRLARRASLRRDSSSVTNLLQPLVTGVGAATADVWQDGRLVALATIIDTGGWAITKASELHEGELRVRLANEHMYMAEVVATRRAADLALLRIEQASDLVAATFVDHSETVPGSYLVSVGPGGDVLGLGTVGAEPLEVADQGKMGIVFNPQHLIVEHVFEGSGADAAGIEIGDRITKLDGKPLRDQQALLNRVDERFPGEIVEVTVIRDGVEEVFDVEIRDQSVLLEDESESRVNGPRSGRATGFASAIWHDTVLGPDQVGGPVVDTSGRVIGINIARAGRVVSYALPAQVILPLVQDMRHEVEREATLTGTGG